MQKIEPKIGIVVVTHNGKSFLKTCIDSLLRTTYANKEILVVDNGSSDGTKDLIIRYGNKITPITNRTNENYAAANNAGIKRLLKNGCEYVLLLNDDTVVKKNLFEPMLAAFRKNRDVGIVGCNISYFDNPNLMWYAGGSFNRLFCYTRHPGMNKPHSAERVGNADFITGCCMMISKKTIRSVGLLDTVNGYYFEDSFYCLKARDRGFLSWVVNECLVRHRVSSSSGRQGSNSLSPFKAYYFARNPFIYIRSQPFFLKISQIAGQLAIRLPLYLAKSLKARCGRCVFSYMGGFFHGLSYLFTGSFPGSLPFRS